MWFAAVVVVLAGLFGMHGLSDHGAHSSQDAGAMASMGTAMSVTASPVEAFAPAAPEGVPMGAGGMCVAVLVLSLIALVVGRWRSAAYAVVAVRSRPQQTARFRGRDPDPPSLTSLSVCRC